MLFKRKPVGNGQTGSEPTQKEVRQRHRLSKPQTSKSSTNLAVLAVQQSASQSTLSVHSEVPTAEVTAAPATHERYLSEKPRPISTVHEEAPTISTDSHEIEWHGAAAVIDAVERKDMKRLSASPAPVQVQKSRRPFSAIMFSSRRSSNSHTASRKFSFEDASKSTEVSISTQGPTVPTDIGIEGAPRVLERRASFTPGTATRLDKVQTHESSVPSRKPVPQPQIRREPSYELANSNQLCEADQAYYYDKARSPTSPLSQLEVLDFERDWEPPAQMERSATPSDLDYHYLGGLRLGSLHVTNGRASPAPSEMSKSLLHRPSALLRRDVSSEYGSEAGSIKRTHTPPPSAWKRPQSLPREGSQSRDVSCSKIWPQSRDVSYSSKTGFTAQSHANGDELPSPTTDRAVSLAMSYMAEMPQSPYTPRASQPNSNSPAALGRSSSPTGSVLVTTKRSEHEAGLFEDETIGDSQGSEEDRDTISTCRTPSDAASHRPNPFDTYQSLRDTQSQGHLQPPPDAREETSDSGYSSNASLLSIRQQKKSLVAQRVKAFEQPRAESAASHFPATNHKSKLETRIGPRPFRASMFQFHRKTAPESVPTMASFCQSTTSLTNSQATTSTTPSRPKTPSKKLQKKRRSSQPAPPEEIMVMGAQPEDEPTIPPVPQHQSANLMMRSQQFPELQRTFTSNHHTKNSIGSPDHSFKPLDIRFPSPPPEPALDETPQHTKSPSTKRTSFVARATRRQSLESQKSTEQPLNEIGEAEAQALVRHFGTTAESLGASPYDIAKAANSRPHSSGAPHGGMITPHNLAVNQSSTQDRRKLTMDDRTAAEYARSKSKSIAERDRQDSVENIKRLEHEKRTVVSEIIGVSAKRPRPHSAQPGLMTLIHRKPLASSRPLQSTNRQETREEDTRPAELVNRDWPQHPGQLPYEAPAPLSARQSPRPDQYSNTQQFVTAPPQFQHWSNDRQHYQEYQAGEAVPLRQPPQLEPEQHFQSYEGPAPLPPRHSPRPSFVERFDDVDDVDTTIPPPPPSHSPRPLDLPTSEDTEDIWAAQAQAWRNRRKSVGEFLGFNSDDLHCDDSDRHSTSTHDAVVEEDLEEELYPVIPPRESQTAYTPHESYNPYTPWSNIWHPAAHHHTDTYEPDLSRITPAEMFQDPSFGHSQQDQPRPLPKPRSRRASGHSQAHSYASSLAEELHPQKDDRPTEAPDFGRYSGGLQYGYEKGKGFGGSAGTRTVSGRAEGSRKGVPLSAGFGVDLSDVPIIQGMRRL